MSILAGKTIILGVTGSIAAYKSPLIVRELVKQEANVIVAMTKSATEFVTPLVLQNLSRHQVFLEMFDEMHQENGSWHIHAARKADALLIAPCSANFLAKLAHGIADSPLAVLALAMLDKPIIVAPAMDSEMWLHPATQRNLELIRTDGATIIPPEDGLLASGFSGIGRLAEISTIIEILSNSLQNKVISHTANEQVFTPAVQDTASPDDALKLLKESLQSSKKHAELTRFLSGKTVLITAGPTYERIDDVRFIGNFSSGKMGFALAEQAMQYGARVVLISGPVSLAAPKNVECIRVESALDMYSAVMSYADEADIAICAAAVADFTPAQKISGKIKKNESGVTDSAHSVGESLSLELVRTPDILATLGKKRTQKNFVLVGFALEAQEPFENAQKKLIRKNADIIVLNEANKTGSGFGGEDNTIHILERNGNAIHFPTMSKTDCAKAILQHISQIALM